MHPTFLAAIDALHPSFEHLVAAAPIRDGIGLPRGRTPGVYLFSEAGEPLYVGRTNDFRGRYGRHCNPSATHRMAAFAFRLAREATGQVLASYRPEGSRAALAADPAFSAAFIAAKARIREMECRFVEEPDPVRQCLLEVYCAVALGTRYNDFDNH